MTNEQRASELANEISRDVAELPDRTSPDDWPEAMLVTGEELHSLIIERFTAALDAALRGASGTAPTKTRGQRG